MEAETERWGYDPIVLGQSSITPQVVYDDTCDDTQGSITVTTISTTTKNAQKNRLLAGHVAPGEGPGSHGALG